MNLQWSKLSYPDAKDTFATLHLFTQIVGKIKLAKLPWINHSWHVTLVVTTSGLSVIDLPSEGKNFRIDFDFIEHKLKVVTSKGEIRQFGLKGISVAEFYNKVFECLQQLEIDAVIRTMPNELENCIPFNHDNTHADYDPAQASNLHNVLLNVQNVFTQFRSLFIGKCSPVHFFWGSFDLAVTRFSGRTAPKHPGGIPNLPDWVVQEAYSHEVSSAGFWPGNDLVPFPVFYSYSYPEPDGYKSYPVLPKEAYYDTNLREFILPYEAVQKAKDPSQKLMDFLQTTYEAAAVSGKWDRTTLEIVPPKWHRVIPKITS